MNGTTGEGIYSLTDEERMDLLEAWMKQKPLIPTIIVQVSGTNLRSAQKMVYLFIYYYRYYLQIIIFVLFYIGSSCRKSWGDGNCCFTKHVYISVQH